MEPRKASVSVLYNGANATAQIAAYINSFKYTDVASASSDSISLTVNDRDHKWIGPWFPVKGDRLTPTIRAFNWYRQGQVATFPCGLFHVDDFSFNGGPIRMSLEGLALPADTDFKAEQRTQTYEKTTLQEIGQAIADRTGIALFYEAPVITIEKVEQNNQSDCDFLNGLIVKYGLALKIYSDRLVVFSEAVYEARPAKFVLTPADFDPGWSWNTQQTGTYTGVKYEYTNSDKNKTFTVSAGTPGRTLTCNEPADNLTEATAIALAALNNANKGTTTISITLMARPGLIASDCVEIRGLGNLSGKYYVEQVTHSLGSGYKMSLELRRVEARITEAKSISSTVEEGAVETGSSGGEESPGGSGSGEVGGDEPETGELVIGGKYTLTSKKTGYYTAAEAQADTPLPGHPTGVRGPGTYWIFNISAGMLNLTTSKTVPGSWVNPG